MRLNQTLKFSERLGFDSKFSMRSMTRDQALLGRCVYCAVARSDRRRRLDAHISDITRSVVRPTIVEFDNSTGVGLDADVANTRG